MGTSRDFLMIGAGVAIGAMAGVIVTNAVTQSPAERAATNVLAASTPAAREVGLRPGELDDRATQMEKALTDERAVRARAEARAVNLEEELARARSSSLSRGPSIAPLDRAALAARLKAIEEEAAAARESKDGKKLVALFVELSRYGKEAWPLAAKLGASFGSFGDDGGAELGLATNELYKAFVTADFAQLYVDALTHPDAYDKTFRQVATWGLSLCDASGVGPALVDALKSEKDPMILQSIAGLLAQNPPAGAAQQIAAAIGDTKNAQARAMLAWALTRIPGDDATGAIQGLMAGTTDDTTKVQLAQSLQVRAAAVPGYVVLNVTPQSDAEQAGLKPGDVITAMNGKAMKGWTQLQDTGDDQGQGDQATVALAVYRDGQTFNITLQGAKSLYERGLYGDFSKGQAR